MLPANTILAPTLIAVGTFKLSPSTLIRGPCCPVWAAVLSPNEESSVNWYVELSSIVTVQTTTCWKLPLLLSICKRSNEIFFSYADPRKIKKKRNLEGRKFLKCFF